MRFAWLLLAAAGVLLAPEAGAPGASQSAQFSVSVTGPAEIVLDPCCLPPRFNYEITISYSGPPLRGAGTQIRFTSRLPEQAYRPGLDNPGRYSVFDCQFANEIPAAVSCAVGFSEGSPTTIRFTISARPSGLSGGGTHVIELDTGARATWTTAFTRVEPPPAPPAPGASAPPPLPGPPAAPTKTIVETFTEPGEVEPQSVPIAAAAKAAQVALTWSDSNDSFDTTGFRLDPAPATRALASAEIGRPPKLRISKTRTETSLNVRIRGLKKGTLRFKLVARELGGRGRLNGKIRQSKRG